MDLINKGGPIMYLLLGCSIVAIAVFLERLFYFHRAAINVGDLLFGLRNLIKNRRYQEAAAECSSTPGPVARVMLSAIRRHYVSRVELKEIVQESGQLEVPKLEKHMGVLLSIAYIAPLLGLLGSVLALIESFTQVNAAGGFTTASDYSIGMFKALVTSAGGLMVAIPAYVFYAYLKSHARNLMHDMERAGIEIVNTVCDMRDKKSDIITLKPDKPVAGEELSNNE